MRIKINYKILLLAIIIGISACEDFIERDLLGDRVIVLTPLDNTISSSYTQSFWWENMKGATKYNLQIVKPSFSSISQLIVDTTITGNQFSYTLQPGSYQWRIRGENNSSFSDYSVFNLTIDSSSNLGIQTLLLSSPSDNSFSNNLTQTFSWLAMPNADNYVFGIYSNAGVQIGATVNTTSTSVTHSFNSEGLYKWRVFAQNSQSASPFSERLITIDTTPPAIPIITFIPFGDTTTSDPIPLSWSIVENNATYTVRISVDSTFVSYVDTTTSLLNYQFYNSVIGQFYFWKVRTNDQAGNYGSFSNWKKFRRL